MKVESYPEVLMDHSQRAYEGALGDTLGDARNEARSHSRTGEHAASLRLGAIEQGDRLAARLGSPLPQAGAVEHGADVGPRRGPHMAGLHSIERAIERYPDHMTRRLRDEPL